MDRNSQFDKLKNNMHPDVLVIGAGINGVSVFLELAKTGLCTVLIDKTDFGSGASNASSRMAHGGIKYLETGDLKLVRQSISARNKLILKFPQYIQPLKLCLPVSSIFGGTISAIFRLFKISYVAPNRGRFILEFGLKIYDWLSSHNKALPKYKHLNSRAMRSFYPGLNHKYKTAFLYFEGVISHPERIAFELVDKACEFNETVCALNHCEFIGHGSQGVKLKDDISGEVLYVKPRLIVNAGGAWIDRINTRILPIMESNLIDCVKGSHLILFSTELNNEVGDTGFVWENSDGRLCILYPIGDKVILGSTEIRITNPDQALCTDEETKYLLAALSRLFPAVVIQEQEIIFRYSGTRPLNASKEENPGAVGRDYKIEVFRQEKDYPKLLVNMIGGKWTTHEIFGKEVAIRVLDELGKTEESMSGNKGHPNTQKLNSQDNSKTNGTELQKFTSRYGRDRGARITNFCSQTQDFNLKHLQGYSKNEISWLILKEAAVKLEDIMLRRTNIAFTRRITIEMIEEIAAILKECLDKSEVEIEKEVLEFTNKIIERNGVSFPDTITDSASD